MLEKKDWDGIERRAIQETRLNRIEQDLKENKVKLDELIKESSRNKGYLGGITLVVSGVWIVGISLFQIFKHN